MVWTNMSSDINELYDIPTAAKTTTTQITKVNN